MKNGLNPAVRRMQRESPIDPRPTGNPPGTKVEATHIPDEGAFAISRSRVRGRDRALPLESRVAR